MPPPLRTAPAYAAPAPLVPCDIRPAPRRTRSAPAALRLPQRSRLRSAAAVLTAPAPLPATPPAECPAAIPNRISDFRQFSPSRLSLPPQSPPLRPSFLATKNHLRAPAPLSTTAPIKNPAH